VACGRQQVQSFSIFCEINSAIALRAEPNGFGFGSYKAVPGFRALKKNLAVVNEFFRHYRVLNCRTYARMPISVNDVRFSNDTPD
jgi:hypothetical protein